MTRPSMKAALAVGNFPIGALVPGSSAKKWQELHPWFQLALVGRD